MANPHDTAWRPVSKAGFPNGAFIGFGGSEALRVHRCEGTGAPACTSSVAGPKHSGSAASARAPTRAPRGAALPGEKGRGGAMSTRHRAGVPKDGFSLVREGVTAQALSSTGVGGLLPPRGRGTRPRPLPPAGAHRFIPAWAGNTPRQSRPRWPDTVHPRLGGVYLSPYILS